MHYSVLRLLLRKREVIFHPRFLSRRTNSCDERGIKASIRVDPYCDFSFQIIQIINNSLVSRYFSKINPGIFYYTSKTRLLFPDFLFQILLNQSSIASSITRNSKLPPLSSPRDSSPSAASHDRSSSNRYCFSCSIFHTR